MNLWDWLTRSRYIESLERSKDEQREDFTARLAEKDRDLRAMRLELAKAKQDAEEMRVLLMAAVPRKVQIVPPKSIEDYPNWDRELQQMLKEEETKNGTHGDGREEVHKQASNDGA